MRCYVGAACAWSGLWSELAGHLAAGHRDEALPARWYRPVELRAPRALRGLSAGRACDLLRLHQVQRRICHVKGYEMRPFLANREQIPRFLNAHVGMTPCYKLHFF